MTLIMPLGGGGDSHQNGYVKYEWVLSELLFGLKLHLKSPSTPDTDLPQSFLLAVLGFLKFCVKVVLTKIEGHIQTKHIMITIIF